MPYGWEGYRRSGVALSTRQTLVVLHLWAQGLGEGDEHPPTLSYCSMVNFAFLPIITATVWSLRASPLGLVRSGTPAVANE